ncbi:hypothetical protein PRIEUP_LOCUS794 [Pristimantis euphronides]
MTRTATRTGEYGKAMPENPMEGRKEAPSTQVQKASLMTGGAINSLETEQNKEARRTLDKLLKRLSMKHVNLTMRKRINRSRKNSMKR